MLDLVKSPRMPLVHKLQIDLVGMIDKSSCLSDVFEKLIKSRMRHAVKVPPRVDIDTMGTVLHIASRDAHRSVLMRTVAKDFYHHETEMALRGQYQMEGPGTYVCGLAIYERDGSFLSKIEMMQLVRDVEQYGEAVEIFNNSGHDQDSPGDDADYVNGSDLDDDSRKCLKLAMEVDNAGRSVSSSREPWIDGEPFEQPRFQSTSKKDPSRAMRRVAVMLQRWIDEHIGDDAKWWTQSPLMVGVSGRRDKRTLEHMSDYGLQGTPNIWGLIISCIKYRQLDVQVVRLPLFTALEMSHINAGEVLGTMLAESMVGCYGLNVQPPGGRSEGNDVSVREWKNASRTVKVHHTFYRDNMSRTIEVLKTRMDGQSATQVDQRRNDLADRLDELKQIIPQLQEIRQEMREVHQSYWKAVKQHERMAEWGKSRRAMFESYEKWLADRSHDEPDRAGDESGT